MNPANLKCKTGNFKGGKRPDGVQIIEEITQENS